MLFHRPDKVGLRRSDARGSDNIAASHNSKDALALNAAEHENVNYTMTQQDPHCYSEEGREQSNTPSPTKISLPDVGAVPAVVKKKNLMGRIFRLPKRKKEKESTDSSLVGRESDVGEVGRQEGREGQDIKEEVHVRDTAALLQDKENGEIDAELRNLSEGEERRGLQGASEGLKDQEKRKSQDETQTNLKTEGEPTAASAPFSGASTRADFVDLNPGMREQEGSANSVLLEEKPEGRKEAVGVGKDESSIAQAVQDTAHLEGELKQSSSALSLKEEEIAKLKAECSANSVLLEENAEGREEAVVAGNDVSNIAQAVQDVARLEGELKQSSSALSLKEEEIAKLKAELELRSREDVMHEILAELKKLNNRTKAIEEARN